MGRGHQTNRQTQRRKNQAIHLLKEEIKGVKNLVSEKDLKIKELEAELEKSNKKIDVLEEKVKKSDDWIDPVVSKLRFDGKNRFKNVVHAASPELEKGTLFRLRKATGINFSNTVINNEPQKSDLKIKIEAFAKKKTPLKFLTNGNLLKVLDIGQLANCACLTVLILDIQTSVHTPHFANSGQENT